MNREEAIEILSDMRAEYNLFGDEEEATRYHVLSWAIQAMKADPVKHGRWVKQTEKYCWHYGCSECGYQPWYERSIYTLRYCPNCGATMTEGEGDDQ